MSAGRLRDRYSVRERSTTRDGRGVRPETYTEKFAIWGEIPREGSTREFDARTEDSLRLRVRYRTDIEIGDQLVSNAGTTYYVRSVLDADGRRTWLQIVATLTPGGSEA